MNDSATMLTQVNLLSLVLAAAEHARLPMPVNADIASGRADLGVDNYADLLKWSDYLEQPIGRTDTILGLLAMYEVQATVFGLRLHVYYGHELRQAAAA